LLVATVCSSLPRRSKRWTLDLAAGEMARPKLLRNCKLVAAWIGNPEAQLRQKQCH
jgi:hypothetical protein